MKEFNVGEVVMALHGLQMWADVFGVQTYAEGPRPVSPEARKEVEDCLERAKTACSKAGFKDSCLKLALTDLVADTLEESGALGTELRNVVEAILFEMFSRKFIKIAAENEEYLDQESLFGETVFIRFPSARDDIASAGNCLAAEEHTAAVFHLMRVAEYGLRSLAKDRRVTLPKKASIDLATWEDIIRQLEVAETAIQGYPKTVAREAQFSFYHGAMMEFKRFKNAFRNRVMHTRETYDQGQAHSAFVHVREFMKILASRISETTRTPVVWKGKKWTTIEA